MDVKYHKKRNRKKGDDLNPTQLINLSHQDTSSYSCYFSVLMEIDTMIMAEN